jgi:hypothetical protein
MREPRTFDRRSGWLWPRLTVSDLLLPSALALWAIGIRDANTNAVDQYGLLTALPLAYFAGFLVLVVSIGVQLARRDPSAPRLALHLVALVFMIHGTAPLVYAEPRYSWTYKHFGVVNRINLRGGLDASIDIYNNWPGFFALAAWFGRIAGYVSPLVYAAWFPLFFNLLASLELWFAFRALPLTDRERWLALFLFAAGNWVAQDYFSPQAMGFVLGMGVFAMALHWLRDHRPPRWIGLVSLKIRDTLTGERERVVNDVRPGGEVSRIGLIATLLGVYFVVVLTYALSPYGVAIQAMGLVLGIGMFAIALHWLRDHRAPRWDGLVSLRARDTLTREPERVVDDVRLGGDISRMGAITALLGVYFVVVFVHELSPYVVAIQMTGLALIGWIRPRWVVLAMWALCLVYLMPRFAVVDKEHHILAALTNPFFNLQHASKDLPAGLPGRQLAATAAQALAFTMWGLGLLGAGRRLLEGRQVLALLALAFSPLMIVFVHSYGGEAVYRAYLFSLPWTACLVASLLRPDQRPGPNRSARLGWLLPSVALLATVGLLLPAFFGLDMQHVMPPGEVRASSYFYSHAEPGSVLLSSPYFPTRLAPNYDKFVINANGSDPNFLDDRLWGRRLGAEVLPILADKIRSYGVSTGYVVLSKSQTNAATLFGILPEGSLVSLERALLNSPNWRVFYRNPDAIIFQLLQPPASSDDDRPRQFGRAQESRG